MNHNSRPKETLEKALALNLNPARYGTFAEIGAGQEVVLQQEALGIVGVNLVYGAFEFHASPEDLLASLLDGLSIERVEIDMVDFSGEAFESVDNRIMSPRLVQLGLSEAAMFSPDGTVLQASEVLCKRPVLVERGSFRPVTKVNVDMFRCAQAQFLEEIDDGEEPLALMEITMNNLMAGGELDLDDFLDRIDVMSLTGVTVLISDYFEFYRLAQYLRRSTTNRIALVLGAGSLLELFNEKYYRKLQGGILEAFGRLFKNSLKLFVYPLRDPESGELITTDTLRVGDELEGLYRFLLGRRQIEAIRNYREDILHIFSSDVLNLIGEGDSAWEEMVPEQVVKIIRSRGLFGFREAG